MGQLDDLVARLDVNDPAFIADPYPTLAALRETTPVFWNERTSQWMLTRFSDIHDTLRDRRLGRSYTHMYDHEDIGRPAPDERWRDFHRHEKWSLLNLEPPDHTRIRRLITKVFTPRAVGARRPAIGLLSRELLDVCTIRPFDLITEYAQPFSVAVICSMLGVPRSDTRQLLDWSHAIVKMYELSTPDAMKQAANRAAAEYIDYTRALIARKRSHPDGLLISDLCAVEDQGERLHDDEIISTTMVLLEAGHEATVNALGNGMRAFAFHPNEWARVVAGDVEPRIAIEEMLRWDSPLQLFERYVLEDNVAIAGQPMEIGQEVAMLFGSADRDPRRFPDPDRFDAGRGDASHITFGGGIHFCVGAPLARVELEVSVRELSARLPELHVSAEPTYHPTFVIRGLGQLALSP